MLRVFLRRIEKFVKPSIVYAHCDIPCGIYDPHEAQVAAHTVLRMTMMLDELKGSDVKTSSQAARLTKVKEEHAEALKHAVRVIWGDYFKEEHLKEHSNLHSLVFKIMKQASKARQEINVEEAKTLLASVLEFSEIFWSTKGRETVKVNSGFPTEGEIVLPK